MIDWPPIEAIEEQGESPSYFREQKPIVGLGLRPSIKGSVRLGEPPESLRRSAFGFDVHAVGRLGIGRGRTFGLWPEVGYVSTGANGRFASVGLGIASQTPPLYTTFASGLSLGVVPHFLLGEREGARATGLRTSLLAEIYLDDGNAWGLEVAHQTITQTGETSHELTFGISLTWMAHRWR
ncbi:MAG: hypothetical protein ACXWUG_13290 [Polyangiales bacterium]